MALLIVSTYVSGQLVGLCICLLLSGFVMTLWQVMDLFYALYFRSKKDLSRLSTRASNTEFTTHGQHPLCKSIEYPIAPIRSLRHSLRPLIASPHIVHSNQRRLVISSP